VLSVNPGVGETVSVLLAAERIFKVKRDSFDYLKYEKLKPIADLAKKDLKEAVKRFQQKRSGDEFFFLIIPIMEREKDSLVWVKAATMSNPQEFVGILIPNQMTNTLSAGDSLIFTENTIFDWMLVEKGKIVAGDYLRRSYKELQNNQ
jgi:uncharacterized protein YegJ (DUF2314 family)